MNRQKSNRYRFRRLHIFFRTFIQEGSAVTNFVFTLHVNRLASAIHVSIFWDATILPLLASKGATWWHFDYFQFNRNAQKHIH
jgi:hypothetical protein